MSDTVHVLCALAIQKLTEAHLAQIQAVSPRLMIHQGSAHSAEELEAALTPEIEVLYGIRGDFRLDHAPALRWVQLESAGVNQIHNTALWRSNVTITNASGVHAVQIAEYVLAVLLAHGRRLPQAYRLQARSEWAGREKQALFMPAELRGATLGVLGYGAIGREAARLAAAFGMRILATKRPEASARFNGWTTPGTGDADGSLPERYYALDELHTMLPECDALLLSLPLSTRTHHLIGARELAAMRPNALLVNIGRGALVDQPALTEALAAGRIGGAALDVTEPEPLPADSPLWSMPNVIITPHISGMSSHYEDRAVELFATNLRRYLAGEELLNVVSRELGY